ncbi:MAG: hypothetical protein AB7O96_14250 [Pseudobdellovibrionaceae bacterium]
MNVFFLVWKNSGTTENRRSQVSRIIETLSTDFSAQLEGLNQPPQFLHRNYGDWELLYWIAPVENWKAQNAETSGNEFALAPEFPFGVNAKHKTLCELGKNLLTNFRGTHETVAPPFSLLYSKSFSESRHDGSAELHLFNDCVGYSPVFTYQENGEPLAFSNKILCFHSLGKSFEVVPEEWALRAILRYFPKNTTGLKNISVAGPQTQISIVNNKVTIRTHGPWIPPQLPTHNSDEIAEFSRQNLSEVCKSFAACADSIGGGLTGGYDSRSLFSTFLSLNLPIRARVKGAPESGDVTTAKKLAELAGIKIKHKTEVELPPTSWQDLETNLKKTSLWHVGQIYSHKFKTFKLNAKDPSVNILGHDGMLVRDPLQTFIRKKGLAKFTLQESIANKDKLNLFNSQIAQILQAYFEEMTQTLDALPFDEAGKRRYFYVLELGRKLSAGSKTNQFGVVGTPLMNPANLSICTWSTGDLSTNFVPQKIVEKNFPVWKDVPYFSWESTKANPEEKGDWRTISGHHYYHRTQYWREIAGPLLEKAARINPLSAYLKFQKPEDLLLLADEITFLKSF